MKEKEKKIISKLKSGDKNAFEKIFEMYSERIYYFSIHYLKNKEEAEEITQEVFVKLWNRRFDLKTDLSFSSYLFMIAKNAVIDLLRKRQKELSFIENAVPDNNIAHSTGTNESIEYKELQKIINKSIDELPDKRKQIFLLSREEGLTYKQISEKLKISIKTVESHMRLALKQLKRSIGDNYELMIIIFLGFSLIH